MSLFEPPSGVDDMWADIHPGTHIVTTAGGLTLHAHTPTPQAGAILARAVGPHASQAMRRDMIGLFLEHTLTAASNDLLWSTLIDPDTDADGLLDEVMRAVATLGTARPTVPSRS